MKDLTHYFNKKLPVSNTEEESSNDQDDPDQNELLVVSQSSDSDSGSDADSDADSDSDQEPQPKKSKTKKPKKRNYDPSWEKSFFVIEANGMGFCLLCESSKGVKTFHKSSINRHYVTNHASVEKKYPKGSVQRDELLAKKKSYLASGQKIIKMSLDQNYSATLASFQLAWSIAKSKKPFNTAEWFKESLLSMAPALFGSMDEKGKNAVIDCIQNLPLSDDTIPRRISKISEQIFKQTICELQQAESWSFAIDSSSDIKDVENLLIYVSYTIFDASTGRYRTKRCYLVDIHMRGRMTGKDMWTEFQNFVDKVKLDWNKLVNCGTDGCPSMLGEDNGFVAHLSKKAPWVIINHCILHLQALAGKQSLKLDNVMQEVVAVISAIMSEKLPHRRFQKLLTELEANYPDMIYFTQVRWLSKGKVLSRFLCLIEEIRVFLIEEGKADKYSYVFESFWICKVQFLADVVRDFNVINMRMQSADSTVPKLVLAIKDLITLIDDRVKEMKKNKFASWKHLKNSTLTDIVSNKKEFLMCLMGVQEALKHRFTDNPHYKFLDLVNQVQSTPLQALFNGENESNASYRIITSLIFKIVIFSLKRSANVWAFAKKLFGENLSVLKMNWHLALEKSVQELFPVL